MATSAAVALLSLVALRIPDTTESSSRVAVNRGPSAAELVSRWRSSVDAGDIESDDVEGDISDDDVAVPSWMLAAVSFEAGAFEPDAFDPGPFDADAIDAPSNKTREN